MSFDMRKLFHMNMVFEQKSNKTTNLKHSIIDSTTSRCTEQTVTTGGIHNPDQLL
jgi:hypothetical protein